MVVIGVAATVEFADDAGDEEDEWLLEPELDATGLTTTVAVRLLELAIVVIGVAATVDVADDASDVEWEAADSTAEDAE